MKMGTFRVIAFCIPLAWVALGGLSIAGWVTNVLWTFKQSDLGNLALGIFGAVVPPVGAVHGIWLWF
jgi:hypothetical protein